MTWLEPSFWLALAFAVLWMRERRERLKARKEADRLSQWYLAGGKRVGLPAETCIALRQSAAEVLDFYAADSTYDPDEWGERPIDRDCGRRAREVIGEAAASGPKE